MRPSKGQIVFAVIVIGIGVFSGVKYYSDHSKTETVAVVDPPRPGCDTVTVATSTEVQAQLQTLAGSYNQSSRKVNGKCFGIKIESILSGTVESRLVNGWDVSRGDAPDVWAPASTSWLNLYRTDAAAADKSTSVVPAAAESLATTPLVIAMSQPMATALGWPTAKVGWSTLVGLANDPAGWGSKGHPEWGQFTFAKTNPTASTSGQQATAAVFAAASSAADLSPSLAEDTTARSFDAALEHRAVAYGDDSTSLLTNELAADQRGTPYSFADAIATTEQSVLDYDSGHLTLGAAKTPTTPTVPLVAIYPSDGTLYSDNPYAVLNASWSTSDREAAAKDFYDFITQPAQQKVFADAGFRSPTKEAGSAITASPYLNASGVTLTIATPSGDSLVALNTAWRTIRKPGRVLILMDVAAPLGGLSDTGLTTLEQAKSAATTALGQLSDTDEAGFWQFSTGVGGTATSTYQELVPVGSVKVDRSQLTNAISQLTPANGTTLFSTLATAYQEMSEDVEPGHLNAVVVLSGSKDSATNDQATLLAQIAQSTSGVHIYAIADGAGADVAALTTIAQASGGAVYDATGTTPGATNTVDRAFSSALANF